MAVERWVRELAEDVVGGAPFSVGDVVEHPEDGRVKIISGQYWGVHGLSNHWTWVPVDDEGNPTGEPRSGYGWRPQPPSTAVHP
mgnify:CR=1 FL=1